MKEYRIGELFQWEDKTLMCVEGINSKTCDKCYLQYKEYCNKVCCDSFRSDNLTIYFTNKLIFSVEGIKLQIKRKGCKVKVKVLELNNEFYGCENSRFEIYKSNVYSTINSYNLAVHLIGDKIQNTLQTEQEAINWVNNLFSLRGE